MLALLVTTVAVLLTTLIVIGTVMYFHSQHQKLLLDKARQIDTTNILCQGFSAKKVSEMGQFDCIIIGSGMGGLTSAALLSRIGKRVLLLEQHDVIGGCTHTFTEKGYEFDTGLHYVGKEVSSRKTPLGYLFHVLGMGGIQWSHLDSVYDVAKISPELAKQQSCGTSPSVSTMEFSSNEKDTMSNLIAAFPSEEQAIKSYFRVVQWAIIGFQIYAVLKVLPKAVSSLVGVILSPFFNSVLGTTTLEVLKSITKNKELIGVLSYMWPDYGLPPGESAFVMTALLSDHFKNGACYPAGGSSVLAENILPIVLAANGAALVRAPVSRIILNESGNEAVGVSVRGLDIYAPCIISAAGVLNTYCKLIQSSQCPHADAVLKHLHVRLPNNGETSPQSVTRKCPLDKVEPSISMFSMFIGLSCNAKELNLPARNFWLYPHWNHEAAMKSYENSISKLQTKNQHGMDKSCDGYDAVVVEREDVNACPYLPVAFLASPSAKDCNWTKRYPDRSVLEVITAADFDSFWNATPDGKKEKPKHRGGRYEVMKSQIEAKLLRIVEEQFPQVKDKIEYVSSGTPMSNNFYLGSVNGEVYGLSHNVARFTSCDWFLRPKTPIRGLYLAGQDVMTDGIVGATGGGLICAISVSFYVIFDLFVSFVSEL